MSELLTSEDVVTCPKCHQTSGNDWSQCEGSCPMPMSPHYRPKNSTEPGDEAVAKDVTSSDSAASAPSGRGPVTRASLTSKPQFTQEELELIRTEFYNALSNMIPPDPLYVAVLLKTRAILGYRAAPETSVAPKWISVEDRYPEVGQDVVYYFDVCGTYVGKYLGEHCFGGDMGFLTDDVTHWMPYKASKRPAQETSAATCDWPRGRCCLLAPPEKAKLRQEQCMCNGAALRNPNPMCPEHGEKAAAPLCKYKDCTFLAGSGGEYCDEHL